MPRESYAACVARHTAILEELYMEALGQLPPGSRVRLLTMWNASMLEIQRGTQMRIDKTEYEYQRRSGKELAEVAISVVKPRAGL